jgi:ankyrin repeat protein
MNTTKNNSRKRKAESWSNTNSNSNTGANRSNRSKKGRSNNTRANNTNNNARARARANKTRRVLAIVGREATTQRWGSNIVHPLKEVVKGDDEFDDAQIKTSTHNSGLTRAMYAAHTGKINILNSLKLNPRTVNVKDRHGLTAFAHAVHIGELESAKYLLTKGADINEVDRDGNTVLNTVSIWDRIDLASFLIENGADVNKPDNLGNTPLYEACVNHSIEMVKLLLDKGANVNFTNAYGQSPLMVSNDLELADLLIENGANEELEDIDGETVISYAVNHNQLRFYLRLPRFLRAVFVGKIDRVNKLLDEGADINQSYDSRTGLILASKHVNYDMIKLLLERGADPNIVDDMNYAAIDSLISAASISGRGGKEFIDILKIFIAHGAKVRGLTIEVAKTHFSPEVFEYLLDFT